MCYKGAARQEPFFILNYLSQSPLCILRFLLLLFVLWFSMPRVVSIILVLLFRNRGCCSQGWEMTPSWGRGQHPDGPREMCCSTKGWVCLQGCLRQRAGWQSPDCAETPDTHLISPELFPQLTHPSLLRINVLGFFCQPPFQPKGTPTHSHHYTDLLHKKKKKKVTGKY